MAKPHSEPYQPPDVLSPSGKEARVVTVAELASRRSEDACWVAIHGVVYDLTRFLASHPGGKSILMKVAGEEATDAFSLAHGEETLALVQKYVVGVLQDCSYIPPVTEHGTIMENLSSVEAGVEIDRCTPKELEALRSLPEMQQEYALRAPSALVLHIDYGNEDDETLELNQSAWSAFRIRPRVLRDTSAVDLSTAILGRRVRIPFGIAPFAASKASHPDGELALVRAARSFCCPFCIPHFGNTPLEEVMQDQRNSDAGQEPPLLLQIYLPMRPGSSGKEEAMDRSTAEQFLVHAGNCGCAGVIVTVDTTVDGNRKKTYKSTAWMQQVKKQMGGLPRVCTMQGTGTGPFLGHTRTMVWDDIAWLCRNPQGLPIYLKGILSPEDAVLCCDPSLGLSGIYVSNHGGRQLDGCEATADVLGEICEVVDGRLPVFVDGGIRRGKDIFRALALGATAVFIGRPAHWGLGLGGQAGVERALAILEEELRRVMILSGCPSIGAVSRSHIRFAPKGAHDALPRL